MRQPGSHLCVALVLAACDRGRQEPKPAPLPSATGSLVLEVRREPDADLAVAKQIEILHSAQLVKQANEKLDETQLRPEMVSAARRAGTTIVDVTVRMPDAHRAAVFCNALIEVYIAHRFEEKLVPSRENMAAIAAELDRNPDNPELVRKLQEESLSAQLLESNARVLDACKPNEPKTR